jgi:hypothetical protein
MSRLQRPPPKPQSGVAITFSRPTISAYCMSRSATNSGCSTKLVLSSTTPGISTLGPARLARTHQSRGWAPRLESMQLERARTALQPAETRTDVVEEARLASLSIVDHVKTDLKLSSHHVGHRGADAHLQRVALGGRQRFCLPTPQPGRATPQARAGCPGV